ncbi:MULTISPECIES: DUF2185 domain-containing protein [unclassified Mesorhizobium]|uniref:DUF2185 domain-containing protein n=1 Tax=unclassified Mesorhizobium TaxID=325217 RepID=UPI000FCB9058|nr:MULTISPECIES: DUF2185 domain-containing protein [unclassified Mesorhizobium]TGP27073.1 DUF2185 domain-containing protein [Mesorhizobium sp. M1D.F.Ca.ET.231.01.1.1]TGP39032.1 DUF2185 domain-containing protein [Mesorhizobium sp. M1D.F.Ca.ET.234.01.1.1]TGS51239.1 DUF2185 domain-containing protein [Mesorhizobium sp. M1D.F.Ca.ET.184.01.1.1]TGS67123.1 DUF2185 domain-containing protein [Mesorhizobium sp. M1D.F.Ca.ET.183.01.1.1]
MPKAFFRDASTFRPIAVGYGSCIATDRITVDGAKVGYLYRETPDDPSDSGWRFFAGDESDEYVENPGKFGLYDVNTIANYDPLIASCLEASSGSAFLRVEGKFVREELDQPTDT